MPKTDGMGWKELMGWKEFDIVPCVECPLKKKYIPVKDNCITLETDYSDDPGADAVRLPGDPEAGGVIFYNARMKCEYAKAIGSRVASHVLKKILCSYKAAGS